MWVINVLVNMIIKIFVSIGQMQEQEVHVMDLELKKESRVIYVED